jgi:mannitol-1-phosphate 5-dehydrogenase
MTSGTAVQFGAGNIGRGFLAQLFHESGLEVVFVDVDARVLEAIEARKEYVIQIVGEGAEEVPIRDIRAIHAKEREHIAREIAACEVVCTAVGANALKFVAPTLAEGILLRNQTSGRSLNVLLCENLHDAAEVLRGAIAEYLPAEECEALLANVGFVQAVVSRMVPMPTPEEREIDPLAIRVEAYKRLPIDGNALVGVLPEIVGVIPVGNFLAHVERKLYAHNCAHAVLGYVGHAKGYTYGYEAMEDAEIALLLEQVLSETGAALILKHGFDASEQAAHIKDLMRRFLNRNLGDTCLRLSRDPLRKLAYDDRLVGSARLCEAYHVSYTALVKVIVTALRHEDPSDPKTNELQSLIEEEGVEVTLERVCRVRADEPLGVAILAEWRQTV